MYIAIYFIFLLFWFLSWLHVIQVGHKKSIQRMEKLAPYIISLLAISVIFFTLSIYDLDDLGSFLPEKEKIKDEKYLRAAYGHFGDFFGGVLSGLFGFLGLISLLITIVFQSKELSKTTEAMKDQSCIFLLQRFENTLYKKIEFHLIAFDKEYIDQVWDKLKKFLKEQESAEISLQKIAEIKEKYDKGETTPGRHDNYIAYEYEEEKSKLEKSFLQNIYIEIKIKDFFNQEPNSSKELKNLYKSYLSISKYIENNIKEVYSKEPHCNKYCTDNDNDTYYETLNSNLSLKELYLLILTARHEENHNLANTLDKNSLFQEKMAKEVLGL